MPRCTHTDLILLIPDANVLECVVSCVCAHVYCIRVLFCVFVCASSLHAYCRVGAGVHVYAYARVISRMPRRAQTWMCLCARLCACMRLWPDDIMYAQFCMCVHEATKVLS